jgi:hypothetical protein
MMAPMIPTASTDVHQVGGVVLSHDDAKGKDHPDEDDAAASATPTADRYALLAVFIASSGVKR